MSEAMREFPQNLTARWSDRSIQVVDERSRRSIERERGTMEMEYTFENPSVNARRTTRITRQGRTIRVFLEEREKKGRGRASFKVPLSSDSLKLFIIARTKGWIIPKHCLIYSMLVKNAVDRRTSLVVSERERIPFRGSSEARRYW